MPLPGPTHIPPIGEQTDPDNVRVAAVIGGQLASAPARGFGLTTEELTAVQAAAGGAYQPAGTYVTPTAQSRNRICNPNFCISQENSNTSATTNLYYAADQWLTSFVTSAGTITSQRVQSVTSNGSKDRYRITITVADASLAAGEVLAIEQRIEGGRVADFRYGGASAKQSILRFGLKARAGTYAVSLRNSATNRSYIQTFVVSAANTDTEYVLTIPGDTSGTWLTDTGIGIYLGFVFACGSTFQGAVGWQTGSLIGTSAVSNGMAAVGSVFELYDIGWHLDPQNTGVAPAWSMPDEAQELAACQRYWRQAPMMTGKYYVANTVQLLCTFAPPMRINPAVAVSNGTSAINEIGIAVRTIDAVGSASGYATGDIIASVTATGTAPNMVNTSPSQRVFVVNARM